MKSEPAFPLPCGGTTGLTKREWFAGMALQGVLAATKTAVSEGDYANVAFALADAMIAASKEGEK